MSGVHLARLAEQAFERLGDFEALWFEEKWHTSRDMFEKGVRLSGGLQELGVAPGDRVAVMLPNGPEVPITYNAIWRAGAAATPLMFLLPPDEVAHIVSDSEASTIVTSPDFLPVVLAAAKNAPTLRWIVCAGDEREGTVSFEELSSHSDGPIVERASDDLASLLYTGGTTGRAKGVMLSHKNHAASSKGLYESTHEPGRTRGLSALPLAHSYGLMITVSGFFATEAPTSYLMSWFDPTQWLSIIQEHKIERSAMVPSMIQILLTTQLEDYDLSSWTFCGVGAAPLAAEVAEEFERRVPSCKVQEGYGCTESGGGATTSPGGQRRLGAVGKAMPGYELQVQDDQGNAVPTGDTGEICIRSDGVMLGYWKSPELNAEVIRDGWLRTGDVGKLDDDGYLYVVDRLKDLIIRGGFNIFPRDVEDVLLTHPQVTSAGVVGKPDPRYGEEVVAFVSLASGADVTEEELIAHCRTHLGKHKYPRQIRITGFLPLTPVGKLDRKALRAMLG